MPRGTMELEIVEVGPSSRPLQYVSRPPLPPPPPPPPPPPLQQQQQGEAGDAHAAPPLVQHFDSEKLPQTLVSEIRPFLRAANDIEAENPRVAYLCKFTCGHALFTLSLPSFSSYLLTVTVEVASCCSGTRRTTHLFVEMPGCRPHPGTRHGGWHSNVCPLYVYFVVLEFGVGNTSECMHVRLALILIPSIGTSDLSAPGPNRIFGG
jgi:hypothetical protein